MKYSEARKIIKQEFSGLDKENKSQYDEIVALLVKYGEDNSRPIEAEVMQNFAEVIEIAEQSLAQWKLHIEENGQKDISDISHWEALDWKKFNTKLQTNKSKVSA
jgi:hypothetical protein